MSDDGGLPEEIVVGDAYALRTFTVKDGRLASIAQGGGHWEDGVCLATCVVNPDPDHVAPVEDCSCGVYAYWTVEELLHQYGDYARFMVAVIRMDGERIEGDNGVKANAAQIVAWWVAEPIDDEAKITDKLVAACVASIPATREEGDGVVVVRRYYDRDVMIADYPPPAAAERRN